MYQKVVEFSKIFRLKKTLKWGLSFVKIKKESSKIWKDKIVQITVYDGGELKMVPRSGKEIFMFGQPVNIEDKFRRMEMYYTSIVPAKGSGLYSTVSVEYDGQIVCR